MITITNNDINKGYLIIKNSRVKQLMQCNDGYPQAIIINEEGIGTSKLFFYQFEHKLPNVPEGEYIGSIHVFGRNDYYAVYIKTC